MTSFPGGGACDVTDAPAEEAKSLRAMAASGDCRIQALIRYELMVGGRTASDARRADAGSPDALISRRLVVVL